MATKMREKKKKIKKKIKLRNSRNAPRDKEKVQRGGEGRETLS